MQSWQIVLTSRRVRGLGWLVLPGLAGLRQSVRFTSVAKQCVSECFGG